MEVRRSELVVVVLAATLAAGVACQGKTTAGPGPTGSGGEMEPTPPGGGGGTGGAIPIRNNSGSGSFDTTFLRLDPFPG
jgi:hypothetical protein